MYLPKAYKDLYQEDKKKKQSKYKNKKIEIDGHLFDSKKEGKRYQELKLQQHCGFIKGLELQPKFMLQEGFRHKSFKRKQTSIKFTPDFRYEKDGELWIEDVKGGKATKTEAYNIRKRLFLNQNPDINFIET